MLSSKTLEKILKAIKEMQPDILEEKHGQTSFELDEVQKNTFDVVKGLVAEQGLDFTPQQKKLS